MSRLCNIILLVAQSCNLHCRYCYAAGGRYGGPPQRMEARTLRTALERLLPLAAPRVTLSFFGGEPLLNLPLMGEAVVMARRLGEAAGREVRFALTTNGTRLDAPAVAWIREHIGSLAVSLDGETAVNDEARRFRRGGGSVHARVLEGLARLREAAVPFALRATLTPASASWLLRSARHLAAQGAVSLRMVPDFSVPWPAPSLAALTEGFAALHGAALERVLDGAPPLGAEGLYPLLEQRLQGRDRERPCGAGEAMVAVAADGSVYPCDHFVGRPDHCMGRVQEEGFPGPGFHRVRQRLSARVQRARTACGSCSVSALCGGECPAVIGPEERPGAAFCRFKRETLSDLGKRLDHLSPDGALPLAFARLLEA